MESANSRSALSLSVSAFTGSALPRTVKPFLSEILPGTSARTVGVLPAWVTVKISLPSSTRIVSPSASWSRIALCGTGIVSGASVVSAATSGYSDRQATFISPPGKLPTRTFGPWRSANAANGRPTSASTLRTVSSVCR